MCIKKSNAFTLAETLIALTVIGIVVIVIIPTFVTNLTVRRQSERHANTAYKISRAMENMRASDVLVTYSSTEAFVNELKKYLLISRVCDNNHIANCWPTKTVIDKNGNEFDVANAKTGRNLGLHTDTNNVGLVLADGATVILNYDNTAKGMHVGEASRTVFKKLPTGFGKTKMFTYTTTATGAIDFLTDTNGKGGPNREMDKVTKKYYDIRPFRSATFTKGCAGEYGTAGCVMLAGSYNAVNCISPLAENQDYCGSSRRYSNDYWAGAKKVCAKAGMHLPNQSELGIIYINREEYPSLKDNNIGWFWTSTQPDVNSDENAMIVSFDAQGKAHSGSRDSMIDVVCIGEE